LISTSITLNELECRNSPYFAFFAEFDRFSGPLYDIGWRWTYNVSKILSPSSSLLLLAETIKHPAARSLCDSWASCLHVGLSFLWLYYFSSVTFKLFNSEVIISVTSRLLRTVRLWWHATLHVCLQLTQVSLLQRCCPRRLSWGQLQDEICWLWSPENLAFVLNVVASNCKMLSELTLIAVLGIKRFRGEGRGLKGSFGPPDPCTARPRLTWSYSEWA